MDCFSIRRTHVCSVDHGKDKEVMGDKSEMAGCGRQTRADKHRRHPYHGADIKDPGSSTCDMQTRR